ncbi:MAG: hypothetical protein ACOC5T_08505 [Elusimicrobiota bacterium]
MKKQGKKHYSNFIGDINDRIIRVAKKTETDANNVTQYLRKK